MVREKKISATAWAVCWITAALRATGTTSPEERCWRCSRIVDSQCPVARSIFRFKIFEISTAKCLMLTTSGFLLSTRTILQLRYLIFVFPPLSLCFFNLVFFRLPFFYSPTCIGKEISIISSFNCAIWYIVLSSLSVCVCVCVFGVLFIYLLRLEVCTYNSEEIIFIFPLISSSVWLW